MYVWNLIDDKVTNSGYELFLIYEVLVTDHYDYIIVG